MSGAPNPTSIARGAASNPANRFERLHVEYDVEPDGDPEGGPAPRLRTQFFKDHAASVISRNSSPDVGFEFSLNPYRGCEHGCAYCYARPYHEYLGFSAGLDFESKIMVKEDAPELLRRELSRPGWKPAVLALSGVTDCYQPVERRLKLTRRCVEVLAEFRNPVSVITKNRLVARDADLFADLAKHGAARVTLSITTLDAGLARELEPRTSPPLQRLEAIRLLAEAGVPVSVNVAPIIPGLNDHEIPRVLRAAAEAGAVSAGWTMLRLPGAVRGVFCDWLDRRHPEKKARVLARIRDVRGGSLNENTFGVRMTGSGVFAEQIRALFKASARRYGLDRALPPLSCEAFRPSGPEQLQLAGLAL